MIRSMTGFGQGSTELQGLRLTVEMRSVNNRFSDLRFRMPSALSAWEAELRRRILAKVRRGRVEIAVGVEHPDGLEARPTLNRKLLDEVVASTRVLSDECGIHGELDLATVIGLQGMLKMEAPEVTWGDDERDALFAAFDQALGALDADRQREGEALKQEMLRRLSAMTTLTGETRERAAAVPDQLKERLLQRLEKLGGELEIDPARLAQEATYLADRADVTEEIVRLEGHLKQARALLESPDGKPLGKRMDFLLQEIHREINTICSKSTDLELTRGALALKAETEKIREQIQNVE